MKFEEIDRRMNELVARPVRRVKPAVMEKTIAELKKKTPKSAKLAEEAKGLLPGGIEHMLSHTNPYPPYMDRGQGSHLWDVDGNEYIDYICGGGPIILGYQPKKVMDGVLEMLKTKGHYHGLCDELEHKAAKMIIDAMPSVEKIRFLQSGTEADMAAARLARVATGKKKIIKLCGEYHGWADQFVIDLWVPHSGRFMANGIPEEYQAHTVVVPQNDIPALEKAIVDNKDNGGVAAVFVEPLGAESGTMPFYEGYQKELREVTKKHGVLLVFDEVVTGFRLAPGGAQEYFGVDPDLTVLGKIIGGGFPSAGAIAGKADLIEMLRSGILSGGPSCFVAGTIAANPITMAGSYYTLKEIKETDAIKKAAGMTDLLVSELNELFEDKKCGWFAYNYASILHIEGAAGLKIDVREPNALPRIIERKTAMGEYQTFLRNEGLMTLMGKGYLTSVHTKEDVQKTVEGYVKLLDATE